MAEGLDLPELAPGCLLLWNTFQEISAGRPSGFGVSPIPPSEIYAWQQLSGVELNPWEFETVLALDRIAVSVMSEKQEAAAATPTP